MTRLINLILLVLTASVAPAIAQSPKGNISPKIDTLEVPVRRFDERVLEEFRSDAAYQYGRPRQGITLWQRMLIWLNRIIYFMVSFFSDTIIGQIIFYTFAAALILYVVLRVLDIDARDLFFRKASLRRIDLKVEEENIHELDFETLIEDAIRRKEYRDGVRLIFLYSLRKLSDARLIQWTPGKTNYEYVRELKDSKVRSQFQELRYYYDYAWYGHFEITDRSLAAVRRAFNDLNSCIA